MRRTLFLVIIFLELSCSLRKNPNKFCDPILTKISDFQDKRQSDSLYQFLGSINSVYRKEAVLAFASVQDTLSAVALGNILLEDTIVEVRKAAAFALGQTGGFRSVNSLIPAASDKDMFVVSEVLEALGKTVGKRDFEFLISFQAKDTITQTGLARGFYQFGLRGLADSSVINRCKEFLKPTYSVQTRLAAAHFFSRSPILPVQNYFAELLRASGIQRPCAGVAGSGREKSRANAG